MDIFTGLAVIFFYLVLFIVQMAVLGGVISVVYRVRFNLLKAFLVTLILFIVYLLMAFVVAGALNLVLIAPNPVPPAG